MQATPPRVDFIQRARVDLKRVRHPCMTCLNSVFDSDISHSLSVALFSSVYVSVSIQEKFLVGSGLH